MDDDGVTADRVDPGATVSVAADPDADRADLSPVVDGLDAETMGERLAESPDVEYRAVGTDLLGGAVRALYPRADSERRHRAFDLPALPEATLAGDLDRETTAVVDPGGGADRRLRTRYVGSVYDPEADPETYVLETSPSAFDAVVCLGETRASQPIE